jgi:hypothetical protein
VAAQDKVQRHLLAVLVAVVLTTWAQGMALAQRVQQVKVLLAALGGTLAGRKQAAAVAVQVLLAVLVDQ